MYRPRSIFTGASIFTLLATAATASQLPAPFQRQARTGAPSLAEIAVPDDTDFHDFFEFLQEEVAFDGAVSTEALAAFLRHAAIDAMEAGVSGQAVIEGEFVEVDADEEADFDLPADTSTSRMKDLAVARDVYSALVDTAPAF